MSEIHFLDTDAWTIYNFIIGSLEEAVKEPLYPGDERRIFGEALAALFVLAYNKVDDAARQKMLRYARGEVLDALGERTNTPRLPPTPAESEVKFSAAAAQPVNIIIPAGTKVSNGAELYFETTVTAILQAGQTEITVSVKSTEGGSVYNGLLPGTINVLVDLIPYISSVANIETTKGASDGEPYTEDGDNNYRERIRLSVGKLSTAGPYGAYRYHALSADPGIASVSITSPSPGQVLLVPLMAGGIIPTQDVLDKVLAACSDKTVRPLTDYVTVEAPTPVPFDIEFKYYTTLVKEPEAIKTIEGAGGAIEHYIAWQISTMGRDINPDQLRRFVLAPDWVAGLTGALRLDVVSPVLTELDGLSVAQFSGNLSVSHEVVEE